MKCKVLLVTEQGFAWADAETSGPIPAMRSGEARECFERYFEPAIRACMERCAQMATSERSLDDVLKSLGQYLELGLITAPAVASDQADGHA